MHSSLERLGSQANYVWRSMRAHGSHWLHEKVVAHGCFSMEMPTCRLSRVHGGADGPSIPIGGMRCLRT